MKQSTVIALEEHQRETQELGYTHNQSANSAPSAYHRNSGKPQKLGDTPGFWKMFDEAMMVR